MTLLLYQTKKKSAAKISACGPGNKKSENHKSIYFKLESVLLFAGTRIRRVTAAWGRRNTILIGGVTFLIGGALNGGAENIGMLILGRVLLGFGVGFTNQVSQTTTFFKFHTLLVLLLFINEMLIITNSYT